LSSGGFSDDFSGNQDILFELDENQYNYEDYFLIKLSKENKSPNPLIYVAKDSECTDRFFAGVQMIEDIYTFIKKDHIKQNNNKFYICTIERQNSDSSTYKIDIKNMKNVEIPYDTQMSYYVYNSDIKNMNFMFNPERVIGSPKVTFWVKGKSILVPNIDGFDNKTPTTIDNGFIFHGNFNDRISMLTVMPKVVGDYITIGSSLVNGIDAKELKENANEIVVAANDEVRFLIKSTSEFSFITGKIYTKRAKTYFTDKNGRILKVADSNCERDITNGIINDINILRLSDIQEGYYCVKNQDKNNQLMILSIQMRKDQTIPAQVYLPPLLPGEIRHYTLLRDQMIIFYGSKPNDDALEVNFNIKSYRGFPEMFQTNCTTFPNCHYTKDSFTDINFLYPSNLVTTYSFYFNELEGSKKNYSPISSYQPLIIVYCMSGGKGDEIFSEDFFCEFETTYFTDQDKIKLYEGASFSQFLYYDEADNYYINLDNEDFDAMYLDLLLFSGDADITLPDDFNSGTANKYYLSNKIFYSIRFMFNKPSSFEFSISATEPTFYLIQYKLFKRETTNEDMNILDSGINYITSKAYGGVFDQNPKHLEFLNYKYEFSQPYLVTLYSPNCIFDVDIEKKGVRERIVESSNEMQRIITPKYDYYDEKFNFYYTIKED
jgi:hypothetical protein